MRVVYNKEERRWRLAPRDLLVAAMLGWEFSKLVARPVFNERETFDAHGPFALFRLQWAFSDPLGADLNLVMTGCEFPCSLFVDKPTSSFASLRAAMTLRLFPRDRTSWFFSVDVHREASSHAHPHDLSHMGVHYKTGVDVWF